MTKSPIRNTCECGNLIEHSENQYVPIIREDDRFFLALSNKRMEIIQFCFLCGGYVLGPATELYYKCECKTCDEWSKAIDSPVKFDDKFCEYYLEGKDGSTSIFYFCPSCGGKLEKSKRENFFLKPSESEVSEIYEKIKNARTIDEVINILGFPDRKIAMNSVEVKKQKFMEQPSVKQTLVYNSVADTFSLIVIEDEDEDIHFLTAGKPKTTELTQ